MEQKIEDIRADIVLVKEDQKKLNTYVETQRIGMRLLASIAVAVGGIFVYYKEHIEKIIFGQH